MCNLAAFDRYDRSKTTGHRSCNYARDELWRASLWHIQVMMSVFPQWMLCLPAADAVSAVMCFAMHSISHLDVEFAAYDMYVMVA